MNVYMQKKKKQTKMDQNTGKKKQKNFPFNAIRSSDFGKG